MDREIGPEEQKTKDAIIERNGKLIAEHGFSVEVVALLNELMQLHAIRAFQDVQWQATRHLHNHIIDASGNIN